MKHSDIIKALTNRLTVAVSTDPNNKQVLASPGAMMIPMLFVSSMVYNNLDLSNVDDDDSVYCVRQLIKPTQCALQDLAADEELLGQMVSHLADNRKMQIAFRAFTEACVMFSHALNEDMTAFFQADIDAINEEINRVLRKDIH